MTAILICKSYLTTAIGIFYNSLERLAGLDLREHLASLAPRERLAGLTPDQIRRYLEQLEESNPQ